MHRYTDEYKYLAVNQLNLRYGYLLIHGTGIMSSPLSLKSRKNESAHVVLNVEMNCVSAGY